MGTITKRHLITNVNGTDELFQLPDEYLTGTLWTFVQASDGTITFAANIFFDAGFFQITPAPAAGSNIYCTYDVVVTDTSDPNNFEIAGVTLQNIVDIITVVKTQQETLDKMDISIRNRLGISAFSKYSEVINDRISRLETLQQI